jgi:hypothetical protein
MIWLLERRDANRCNHAIGGERLLARADPLSILLGAFRAMGLRLLGRRIAAFALLVDEGVSLIGYLRQQQQFIASEGR